MKNKGHMIHLEGKVPNTLAGKRLDHVLTTLFPDYSRARLQSWIRAEQVWVDGLVKRQRDLMIGGENIIINAEIPAEESWQPEAIDLAIVYEDEHLLVVNKPIGLVVHPAAGNLQHTLLNALLHHAPQLNQLPRGGIVHRLDKDTSGLLVVAKTLHAHTNLIKQLQTRSVKREYQAVVSGRLISGGSIDEPIGRHPQQRKKMAVTDFGKTAITHFRILEKFPAFTRLKINLETGRTHQIRVHMAYIHHPIVGDSVYGGRLQLPKNANELLIKTLREYKHQALHAETLGLLHPATQNYLEWSAPLPADMQQLLKALREDKLEQEQGSDEWF